jgi:hypothetical protein
MAIKAALICSQCGSVFLRARKFYNLAIRLGYCEMFCSRTCQGLFVRRGKLVKCALCGKEIIRQRRDISESKSGEYFCSQSCANSKHNRARSGEKHHGYICGAASYREKALKYYGKACTVCGYNVECVLEVHHKDGNRKNNKIENLDVLCPTHHSEFEHGIRSYGESSNGRISDFESDHGGSTPPSPANICAAVAQTVEHSIRNGDVSGSIPLGGPIFEDSGFEHRLETW